MKKHFLFIVLVFFSTCQLHANFMGFERAKLGAFRDSLNILQNNRIKFIKERLTFKLGQRIQFAGSYWFANEKKNEQNVIFGFPQESFWAVPFDPERSAYLPGDLNRFNPKIEINGKDLLKIEEYYTPRDIDFDKKVKFTSRSEMNRLLVEYAQTHEAESPPCMPILIWKVFDVTIPAKSVLLIEVEFEMPWFYEDEIWSDNIRTNGIRFFKYITSTAKSWAGGLVADFRVEVEYPDNVGAHLRLLPQGWTEVKPGRSVLIKTDYKPGEDNNICFLWQSDYSLEVDTGLKHKSTLSMNDDQQRSHGKLRKNCWECLYYKDFHWRFLTDNCPETAWAFDLSGLECPRIEIRPINDPQDKTEKIGKDGHKKIKIVSGYAKNKKLFYDNNRPREIEFYFGDRTGERSQVVILKDTFLPQEFDLEKPGLIPHAFRIKEIYKSPGSKEVYFSELSFVD